MPNAMVYSLLLPPTINRSASPMAPRSAPRLMVLATSSSSTTKRTSQGL